jgi:hypothetical protein
LSFLEDLSQLPSFPSEVRSPAESFRAFLETFARDVADVSAASKTLDIRDVRREAIDGIIDLLESSSLSEGRREPSDGFFIGDIPRTGSDMAEGKRIGRVLSSAGRAEPAVVAFGTVLA